MTSLFAELWPGFHTEGGSAAGLEALPAGRAEAKPAYQPFAAGPEDEITGVPRGQDQSRQPNGDPSATAPFLPAELLPIQNTRNGEEISALVLLSPWDEGTSSGGRSSGVMGGPDGAQTNSTGSGPAFEGLLVSWAPNSSASERAQARQALNLSLRETIHTAAMQSSGAGVLEWVDLPPGLSAEQAIATLSRRPGVAYAEKNWKLESQVTSNDPSFTNGSLWGMYGDASNPANSFGSHAAEAWSRELTGNSSVVVGIIDEGYQYAHPDLAGNAGVNPGETAENGIDDDNNGFIDDIYGWDFVSNNNSVYDGTGDDHGTHVAGTIGGQGGNGIGVVGVNWDVSLLSGKFLGANGGTTANAIKAVDYFTDLKTRHGLNLVATNNSWGGGGFSQTLYDAISRANQASIFFVAAAGNSSTNNLSYPAGYDLPNVISVASINSTGGLSSFSNFSSTWVDLGAPGEGIYSTLPSNVYGTYSGTSMATPHVTGAIALMKSAYPTATMNQIKQALFGTVIQTSSLFGKTVTGGRLDVNAAITQLGLLVAGSSGTNLPVISVGVTDANATETVIGSTADPGSFTLRRSGDNTAALNVTVSFSSGSGNASNGIDYNNLPGSITFAIGSDTAIVVVTPIDDATYEGSESVTLSLQSGNGYTISSSANTATLNITDNESPPSGSKNIWGTTSGEVVTGDGGDNIIGGVSQSGTDTGRGIVDTLIGNGGADTFVLAQSTRGTFYNDGNSKSQGFGDYAQINDFNTFQGDKLQLRSGSQYLYRFNGSDTELFLGDGNQVFGNGDEFICKLAGVNLTSGNGVWILGTGNTWTTFA